jgi:hypothetical protein
VLHVTNLHDPQIREFALGGLTRRLKIVGVPLDTL